MTTGVVNKEQSEAGETREITFKCRICGRTTRLNQMKVLTRFKPPVVACPDCERNW